MRRDLEKMRDPINEPGLPHDLWDNTPPHIKERMKLIKSVPGWWKNLEPLKIGFDIVNLLRSKGLKIHALTKGPLLNAKAWEEKVIWCQQNLDLDKGDRMTITTDKGLVYGKILVDDYPGYAKRWLRHRPRGLVIMPLSKNNADYKHPQVVLYDGTNLEEVEQRVDETLEEMKKREKRK